MHPSRQKQHSLKELVSPFRNPKWTFKTKLNAISLKSWAEKNKPLCKSQNSLLLYKRNLHTKRIMSVMEAYTSNPNPCMTEDASSLTNLNLYLKETFTVIQIHCTKSTYHNILIKKSHNIVSSECIRLGNFDFNHLIQTQIRNLLCLL